MFGFYFRKRLFLSKFSCPKIGRHYFFKKALSETRMFGICSKNLFPKTGQSNLSPKTSRPHVENGKLFKSCLVLHEGQSFLLKKLSFPFETFGIYSQGGISPPQTNFLDLKIARSHLFCHFFPLCHGCFLSFSQLV